MLSNDHIIRILRESSLLLEHSFDAETLRFVEVNNRTYSLDEFTEFKRDLLEASTKIRLLLLEYQLEPENFRRFSKEEENYILAFKRADDSAEPVLIHPARKKRIQTRFTNKGSITEPYNENQPLLTNSEGEVIFFLLLGDQGLVSDYGLDENVTGKKLSPVSRLFRLLHTERKEINYILFYALVAGLISLVLPLGIQTTVELISGGVFFSSVYVLIAIIIIGVLLSGGIQIFQITLVEHLQRKIFAKASLEFAFRIPRLRAEAIIGNHAPELVNRFFDIMTIQKGMPKLLIDLSAGVIQILFGLLLLSLYHPFFVFFSIGLLSILVIIFYITGAKGLYTSIEESKYKYKVAHWLEELARAINSFKLAGSTDLPIKKTDYNVNNYLKFRSQHFKVLITQFSFILFFKAAVTGGLLVVGTYLVVDRQITLGQFVASEVIIILLLNSVEKIIMYMDVLYDLLTAVDKVAAVTDVPLEKIGGLDMTKDNQPQQGFAVRMKDLKYKYPDQSGYILKGLDLEIAPGEHICISGAGGAGKTTLTNIISGIYTNFEGVVTINGYSIRDLDLTHLRDKIGKNISQEDIFDGTILENITVGKPMESVQDAIEALEQVGLADEVNRLPQGLNTRLNSGGKNWSNTNIHKLILARCLAKKPRLLILNDFFNGLKRQSKLDLVQCVVDRKNHWTLVAVSNDPLVMAACDKVVVLSDGKIEGIGKFDQLMKDGIINKYVE
ncbi:MAG: ATP-binding cassette domain-containing protein [Cyclobacteriaceae bacterium]|nr:ATP-binding cassette domain-containing protein [Cyclobacteriaceae bacterium]UYN86696.1 MAG: ATP-binding cassette domain-containing protein [Cyclobacteriaceae bacterium]